MVVLVSCVRACVRVWRGPICGREGVGIALRAGVGEEVRVRRCRVTIGILLVGTFTWSGNGHKGTALGQWARKKLGLERVGIKCKDALHGTLSLFLSLPGPRTMLEIRPRADGGDAMAGGGVEG